MSETATTSGSDEPTPEELEEAERFAIPIEHYVALTKRERNLLRGRRKAKLRGEARTHGLDAEKYLAMQPEERAMARIQAKYATKEPDPEDEPDHVPQNESDPERRDEITLGPIVVRERRPDFVGKAPPRTLRDLYTYFDIGDGQHVIRIERLEPRVYQGIPTAGYLGEIKERISEAQFQRYFGGRLYEAQVYGPDPKGAHDEQTGLPKIKALTDAIKITVPLLPPNLHVLPAARPEPEEAAMQGVQGFNPFAAAPATPADAKIHESNMSFLWKTVDKLQTEKDSAVRAAADAGTGAQQRLFSIIEKQHEDSVAALKREQDTKDRAHEERLAEEREARKKVEERLDDLKKKVEDRKNGSGDAVEMVKALQPNRNASEEIQRITESFKDQITRLKESHEEARNSLKDRQDEEIKRLEGLHKEETARERGRFADMESHYKKTLDDERAKRAERERELRDEAERVRVDERTTSDRRVDETKQRYEDRIKDLDRSHDREIKSNESRWDMKLTTIEATLKMELSNLKERLTETKEELAEAQDEARKAGDPVEVLDRAKKSAEALGYEKPEDKRTATETFMEAAGAGLGQMLGSFDKWWPQTLDKWNQRQQVQADQQQARQLPPRQQEQIAAARQRRTAWASEGSVPVAHQAANVPPTPLGFQPEAQPVQPVEQPAAEPAQPQEQAQPPAQKPRNGATAAPANTNPLGQLFSDEAIEGFRQNVEQAINSNVPAEMFAQQLATVYKEPSQRLVSLYKHEDFLGYVKGVPNGATSPILRRDGKAWIEALWAKLREIHTQ